MILCFAKRTVLSFACLLGLVALGSSTLPRSADALPRFALRQGVSCSACHVNPTGGGIRNFHGIGSFTRRTLAKESTRTETARYDGEIGHSIRIGTDLRFQFLFEQGQKTVEDTLTENTSRTGFHIMAASLYAAIQPVRDLTFYLRYDPETEATEAYAILANVKGPLYIKMGAFSPDYGLRFDDHTAYTRGGDLGNISGMTPKGLLFTPDFRDAGIEIGYERSWYRITAAHGNGDGGATPFGKTKASLLRAELRPRIFGLQTLAGFSLYAQSNDKVQGFFGGLARGRLAVLGELDRVDGLAGVAPDDSIRVQAWALEGTFELFRGVHLYARLDNWDPDVDVTGETFGRMILGLELFPFPYFEIRPQYRINSEPASVDPVRNNLVMVQAHIYL